MPVYFNGKTAVNKGSGGTLVTQDVCLTTKNKIPVTYNNIAKSTDADNTAKTVFVNGNQVCHKKSIFKKSTGDEGGDHKGQKSGSIQGKAEFITASNNVYIEGIPAVRQGDLMVSNNKNTPPAQLQQPGSYNAQQADSIKQKILDQPKGPNQINFDIFGENKTTLHGQLVAELDKNNVSLGNNGEKQQGNLKQLTVRNLPDGKYNLRHQLVSSIHEPISIPLGKQLSSQVSADKQPDPGSAKNLLIPVNFLWRNSDDGKSLNPAVGDYADIARFTKVTRENIGNDICSYLQQNSKVDKPWTEMLQSATKSTCDRELKQYTGIDHVRSGWLYIYQTDSNNKTYLWRELQVKETTGMSVFGDVDLAKEAGKDIRTASGMPCQTIVFPHKIDNKQNKFCMAFSETQWSWEHINDFGGMDAEDLRLQDLEVPQATSEQQQNAEQNRKSRFDFIKLDPFADQNAKVGTKSKDPNSSVTNALITETNTIPTILVSDPVGLAGRIQVDLANAWFELKDLMNEAKQDPYFKSALLTYRTFFDPNVAKNSGMSDKDAAELSEHEHYAGEFNYNASTQPNTFKQNQDNLDKDKLEKILKVKERKAVREKIKMLQTALIQIVQDKNTLSKITSANKLTAPPMFQDKGVDFNTAIADAFSAKEENYLNGFLGIFGLSGNLANDPSSLDHSLDIPEDNSKGQITIGGAYILTLSDEEHPLHDYVFPESSKFQQKSFAALFSLHGAGMLSESLGQFSQSTLKSLELANNAPIDKVTEKVLGLAKATDNNVLNEIQYISYSEFSFEKYDILGFDSEITQNFINKQNTISAANNLHVVDESAIPIYNATVTMSAGSISNITMDEKQPIAHVSKFSYRNFQGVRTIQRASEEDLKNDLLAKWSRSGKKMLVRAKNSAKVNLIAADKVIAPIFFALQLWNTKSMYKNFTEDKSLRSFGGLGQSALLTIYAFETTSKRFIKKDDYLNFFEERAGNVVKRYMSSMEKIRFKLTPLGLAGAIGCVFGGVVSTMDAWKDLEEGDYGAMWGEFIETFGYGFSCLTILAEAADTVVFETLPWLEVFGGPLAWAGTLLIIIGSLVVGLCEEDDITKWTKQSPFSKAGSNRISDYDSYVELLTLLIKPRLTVKKDVQNEHGVSLNLDILTPRFTYNSDALDVRFTQEVDHYISSGASHMVIPSSRGYQKLLHSDQITQLKDEKGQKVGFRFHYTSRYEDDSNIVHGRAELSMGEFAGKARLYLEQKKYQIPKWLKEDLSKERNDDIVSRVEDDPSWLYSNKLKLS